MVGCETQRRLVTAYNDAHDMTGGNFDEGDIEKAASTGVVGGSEKSRLQLSVARDANALTFLVNGHQRIHEA